MLYDKRNANFFNARDQSIIELCDFLGPKLNHLHDVNFSIEFWRRVLDAYARSVINQQPYYECPKFEFPLPFLPINGWVPASITKVVLDRTLVTLRSVKRGKFKLPNAAKALEGVKKVAFGTRGEIVAGDLAAVHASFDWVRFLGMPDRSVRHRLNNEAIKLSDPVRRNAYAGLPKIYVEYFPNLLTHFSTLSESTVREIFVEHYGSFYEMVLAAYLSEVVGAQITQLQTGGGTGETTVSIGQTKRSAYDRLLTYGWQISGHDKPFYAIRLEEFKKNYQRAVGCGDSFDVLFMLGQAESSEELRAHYSRCVDEIRSKLDRAKYLKFRFRPRATSRALRIVKKPISLNGVPKTLIDDSLKPIASVCSRARIIVQLTMPATNFHECIFIDKPVLAIDTNNIKTQIALPFHNFFHECGVFHRDVAELVKFLNNTDIDEWWAKVVRDYRYQEYKRQFARSKADYQTSEQATHDTI